MIRENFKISAKGSSDTAQLSVYILETTDHYRYIRRPLVLICPGGGYEFVSQKEGEPFAMRFAAMGYHTAVLTYSVRPSVYPAQILETAQAVKIIRENAECWNVQPDRLIIVGCSAGGHLAASYSLFCGENFVTESTGLTYQQLRPAGMILCYPVISSGQFAHRGSFEALLGKSYGELSGDPLLEKMSLENHVTESTPPAFIWHTFTDNLVPVENSLLFAKAMAEKKVPCELHIFPDGGHGLALADEITRDSCGYGLQPECAVWTRLARTWLAGAAGLEE